MITDAFGNLPAQWDGFEHVGQTLSSVNTSIPRIWGSSLFGVGSPDQWVTRAKAGPGGGTRPQNEIGKRRLAGLGDAVPEPLGFIAFRPEWLFCGRASDVRTRYESTHIINVLQESQGCRDGRGPSAYHHAWARECPVVS